MRRVINNAILVPHQASTGRILVQRRGHRPPPWGFFGGGIEAGERPLQAVIREAQEELSFLLSEGELTYAGVLTGQFEDLHFTIYPFLWPFPGDLKRFIQREGAGMELVTVAEMLKRTIPGGPDHTLTLALENIR